MFSDMSFLRPFKNFLRRLNPLKVESSEFEEEKTYFGQKFDKMRLSEFHNGHDETLLFPPPLRSRLVLYIMERVKVGFGDWEYGISYLIHENVFHTFYPIHDGPALTKIKDQTAVNTRQKLQKVWASFSNTFHYQPIDAIKGYFGQKVAFYYAFVGFYISWLFPVAGLGIVGFIFGAISNAWFEPVKDICNPKDPSLFYMCPLCDKTCSYHELKDTCVYARLTHCFDNDFSLIFTFIMLIWAMLLLKFWKREEYKLSYKWNSMNANEHDVIRPQYVAAAEKKRENPVTGKSEPARSKRRQALKLSGTWTVVVFFIFLVIGAVIGVVVYRAALYGALVAHAQATGNTTLMTRAKMIVTATAALLNLIVINILKFVYKRLAIILTDWENPRTLFEYEKSFTVKMFWFQFVNTYSSIFYVAFFRGEIFAGWPGNYRRFGKGGKYRFEGCSEQGCFLELCVQIMVLMIGQQLLGNFVELLWP